MSGIAGVMTRGGAPDPAPIEAMAIALRHRGAPRSRRSVSGDVAMIGSSDGSTQDQPHLMLDGRPAPTIGEAAARFSRDRGGAAALAAALGSGCAVALHDPLSGRLVLARDRCGVKPLYYREGEDGLAFASEPGALIEAGLVPAQLVRQVRNELLQAQFTTGRETIFASINRLLPGEAVVAMRGRIVERLRLAALPEGPPVEQSEGEALARLEALLTNALARHRVAGRPCGTLLGSGIADAALLAGLARGGEGASHAVSAAFTGAWSEDDWLHRRAVAQACGAEWLAVELAEVDFWRLLPEAVAACDDPVADYAILPAFKAARVAAAAGLTALHSGEGGDMLFAGYGRYRAALRPWWAGGKPARSRGILEGLGILRGDLAGWRDGIGAAELGAALPGRTRLQIAQAADCADWLPNNPLLRLDRCLSAHGITGAAPFLDPDLAAFAYALPDALKIAGGVGCRLLRRWLDEVLPAAAPRAKRKGGPAPIAEWLGRRGAALGPLVAAQPGIREICLPDAAELLFRRLAGKRQSVAAWTLLFYALWHRHHILRLPQPPDVFTALAIVH